GLPLGERTADRALEVIDRDPGDHRARADEVADGGLRPLQRDLTAVHTGAELEVREGRLRSRNDDDRRHEDGRPPHRGPARSARTRCSKSASAWGRRATSPLTMRTAPATVGSAVGGVTAQPSPARTTRNTPWLKPSTCGTLGPSVPRKTTTRSSTENVGAPT